MTKHYDTVLIGAGIIGSCTALELARKGHRTLNIEKLAAAGSGSTSNTCAIIRLHYSTPLGVAMAREGYFYWIDWPRHLGVADEAGMAKYVNTGCLVMKTDKNKYLQNVMASLDELSVVYQELDEEGIREKLSYIDTRSYGPPVVSSDERFGKPTQESVTGAVYIPESGFINDPQLSVHNVQRACEARGGEFLFNAEVVEILKRDGHAVGVRLADGSEIHAPVVINVSGPHSSRINRMAGVEEEMKMTTRALKQEVCHVPAPENIEYDFLGTLISDGDIGCYSRPETGNHVLIGSEDPECDELEWVEDPDDYDKSFTDQWKTQVVREAQRVAGLELPSERKGLVDLYDCTPDWIPIYDKSSLPGFYMAVGTSGNQFKNAPVVGLLMSELIEKVEAGQDHDRDPVTFEMKYTGRSCDIGFFSRSREINPDSSFSVIG
jgi:sarcosine oxidase subunit beta